MGLATSLIDTLTWQFQGLLSTEATRRIYYNARALWQPAEFETRRGIGRELATGLLPELRLDQGYLRLPSPPSIPDVSDICAVGRAIVGDALKVGVVHGDKQFSRNRAATMEQRTALLRIALDRRMLAMAASYLGVLPVITEADFYSSFAVTGPFTKSQLWHCDGDAGDVLKVFIYCDDVGPKDGPFELVPPETSRRVRQAIAYRYAGKRYRVADDLMDAHAPREFQIAMEGPAGTAFVVDTTRCFHRGSRIVDPAHRRVAAVICYCPPTALTLPRQLAGHKAPLITFAEQFTDPIERAALGIPVASRWI
jgi:hypothetical protein